MNVKKGKGIMQEEKNWFEERFRRLHLDFHIPGFPVNALKNFNAKGCISIIKEANADSAVFYTKCHYGNSYYDTKVGHKHPKMKGDIFGSLVKEVRSNDIKVFAYYSVCWDNYQTCENPDWLQRDKEGKAIAIFAPKSERWYFMCLNSPYLTDLLLPQLEEITRKYNPDGFWLDIVEVVYGGGCYCRHCQEKYRRLYGKSILDDSSQLKEFRKLTVIDFLKEARRVVKGINPDILISFTASGERQMEDLIEYVDFLTVEGRHLEPHKPSSAGALDTIAKAKYAQNFDKPADIAATRFFYGYWGEIAPVNHLKFQFAQIISHGSRVTCIDQANIDGRLEKAIYKVIGEAFQFVKEREPWVKGAKSIPYIAILYKRHTDFLSGNWEWEDSLLGAIKILTEKHWHFDILCESEIERLKSYQVLICPDLTELKEKTLSIIRDFVKGGGNLLCTSQTSLIKGKFALSDLLGVEFLSYSPYSLGYFKLNNKISNNCPDMPLVLKENFLKVEAKKGVIWLADLLFPDIENPPTEEESMHWKFYRCYSPPDESAHFPAITLNKYGKGNAIYISAPIFTGFWKYHYWHLREVVHNLLDLITPDKIIQVDAPSSVEVNLMRQDKRIIVHLINYSATRSNKDRPITDEIPIVRDISVKISKSLITPKKVYLAPKKISLKWKEMKGQICTTVPEMQLYEMVVFE